MKTLFLFLGIATAEYCDIKNGVKEQCAAGTHCQSVIPTGQGNTATNKDCAVCKAGTQNWWPCNSDNGVHQCHCRAVISETCTAIKGLNNGVTDADCARCQNWDSVTWPCQNKANVCNCYPTQDCSDAKWGSWSACSATCGTGTQSRDRTNPKNGCAVSEIRPCQAPVACPGAPQLCGGGATCPSGQTCKSNSWGNGNYGATNADCHKCAHGSSDWPCKDTTHCVCKPSGPEICTAHGNNVGINSRVCEQQCGILGVPWWPCNTGFCHCKPSPIPVPDCDGWKPWSQCTKSCGGGIQTRTKPDGCPHISIEERACNTEPCLTDCNCQYYGLGAQESAAGTVLVESTICYYNEATKKNTCIPFCRVHNPLLTADQQQGRMCKRPADTCPSYDKLMTETTPNPTQVCYSETRNWNTRVGVFESTYTYTLTSGDSTAPCASGQRLCNVVPQCASKNGLNANLLNGPCQCSDKLRCASMEACDESNEKQTTPKGGAVCSTPQYINYMPTGYLFFQSNGLSREDIGGPTTFNTSDPAEKIENVNATDVSNNKYYCFNTTQDCVYDSKCDGVEVVVTTDANDDTEVSCQKFSIKGDTEKMAEEHCLPPYMNSLSSNSSYILLSVRPCPPVLNQPCQHFTCPAGSHKKPRSANAYCHGVCKNNDQDWGYALDKQQCCEENEKCSSMECPAGTGWNGLDLTCRGKCNSALLDNQFPDQDLCCESNEPCERFKCPDGFNKKFDEARFSCVGYCAHDSADTRYSSDRDACCLQAPQTCTFDKNNFMINYPCQCKNGTTPQVQSCNMNNPTSATVGKTCCNPTLGLRTCTDGGDCTGPVPIPPQPTPPPSPCTQTGGCPASTQCLPRSWEEGNEGATEADCQACAANPSGWACATNCECRVNVAETCKALPNNQGVSDEMCQQNCPQNRISWWPCKATDPCQCIPAADCSAQTWAEDWTQCSALCGPGTQTRYAKNVVQGCSSTQTRSCNLGACSGDNNGLCSSASGGAGQGACPTGEACLRNPGSSAGGVDNAACQKCSDGSRDGLAWPCNGNYCVCRAPITTTNCQPTALGSQSGVDCTKCDNYNSFDWPCTAALCTCNPTLPR